MWGLDDAANKGIRGNSANSICGRDEEVCYVDTEVETHIANGLKAPERGDDNIYTAVLCAC